MANSVCGVCGAGSLDETGDHYCNGTWVGSIEVLSTAVLVGNKATSNHGTLRVRSYVVAGVPGITVMLEDPKGDDIAAFSLRGDQIEHLRGLLSEAG